MADLIRLSEIDDSNRDAHYHLTPADYCFFIFEYTSQRNYSFSQTNNLISNLKKKPSQSHLPGYGYKQQAIAKSAQCLAAALNREWLQTATLVPIPGSKIAGHADFDDRMERICRLIPAPDVRTLIYQTHSTDSSHEAGAGERITVEELLAIYRIDETVVQPTPTTIAIMDDVLTAGTHYRAMHRVLSQRFPQIPIVGIFIARRVFPE
ncbi:hypothetical protein MRS76_10465 [Rhizobiaceae bacterium n13]|uniref:hypothetical protein n=1 Tax=Ferirhizobium litorale TaxID=2927786 RepID=UPI0024B2C016|nr:hypothetical protein [Fererhizobium litorale]MDI7862381.1 hypothetical protein [Fererhizobium litorale]